jgi:hypothetical protein
MDMFCIAMTTAIVPITIFLCQLSESMRPRKRYNGRFVIKLQIGSSYTYGMPRFSSSKAVTAPLHGSMLGPNKFLVKSKWGG